MIVVRSRLTRASLMAVALVVLAARSGPRDPDSPEEASARGDELLRKTSDTLKAAPALDADSVDRPLMALLARDDGTCEPLHSFA